MSSDVFDWGAARYDAWYDTPRGGAIWAEELDAICPLLAGLPRPWLEVGVGTGRFAACLGIEVGVDPALHALRFASNRGIRVAAARGEALPFRTATFGAVLITVTLCFVADPLAVLREAQRVMRPAGGMVLGLILAQSPWGQHYQRLAAQGHPTYRSARFLPWRDVIALLHTAGLRIVRTRSALFWSPEAEPAPQPARDGMTPLAGFTALLVAKANPAGAALTSSPPAPLSRVDACMNHPLPGMASPCIVIER